MDWNATDLESTWKAFRQHADFMFSGPLKKTSEPRVVFVFNAVGRGKRENDILDVAVERRRN